MNKLRVFNIVEAKVWGGGEQYVYDTAKIMAKNDVEVFVAVDRNNKELQRRFSEVANVVVFDFYSFARLKDFLKVKDFVVRNNIDIVNCHSGRSMLLAIYLKLTTAIKLVAFKHNAIAAKHDFYHRWQRKHTDAFICVSKLVYEKQTEKLEDDNSKYHLVYGGIDTERFNKVKDSEFIVKDKFIIGYAGRIVPNKGINTLLEAFNQLSVKYPDMQLLLAGADEKGYLKDIEQYISANKLDDKVKCIGYVSELESYYKNLNVFVLPSVVEEAFGLVLCEAMYCGAVVITTDSGAQNEIIDDGIDGYIFDNQSATELVKFIEKIYLHWEAHEQMVQSARKKVLDKFSADLCVDKILKIYNNLL